MLHGGAVHSEHGVGGAGGGLYMSMEQGRIHPKECHYVCVCSWGGCVLSSRPSSYAPEDSYVHVKSHDPGQLRSLTQPF